MRPLRLELKGFTAFREPAAIEFTDLDVFAISGPTGSGKSSLLDAMTYSLYGRVERVGDRVGQLISQGQPRMAVTLEFEVGHERYRVTRSTPAKGATKILLERLVDDEWKQAGEGADRVREAEPLIARAIGLTYDGFTRSVLLPQGKFAEFLVGDAKKRRDILTELLGLSLFRRMAERAGSTAKEAALRAQERTLTVEREYADATPEALRDARAAAKEAERRERALAAAAEFVVGVLARWREAERAAEELRACAAEAADAADEAADVARALADLVGQVTEATARVERCASAAKAADVTLGEARAALVSADATLGSGDDLQRAQLMAHSLAEAVTARDRKAAELAMAAEAAAKMAGAVDAAKAESIERTAMLSSVQAELRAAETALEEAQHADLVSAVSAGLEAGDPCPVCGLPLEKAPKRTAGRLDRAARGLEAARKAVEAVRTEAARTERTVDSATRDVEANSADQTRLTADTEELDRLIAQIREELLSILGDPLPDDPAGEIARRSDERRRLDVAEREAARHAVDTAQALMKAEQDRGRLGASIDRYRDRLAVDHRPLFDRAARAAGVKTAPAKVPAPPPAGEPEALRRYAEKLAGAMTAFAERLARQVEDRASIEETLFREATDQVGHLVEPAATLESLAEEVNSACRAATADVATTAHRSDELAARLERRKVLTREADELRGRAEVFRTLALELRADRLIAFLQAEALQVLAAAGSERLAALSDGRYRLICHDDEFSVVDTWNGDEERSVRTLSGGETFLASLALALALADQVRSLSVTDRARLDSLFLDEGFGTLDPDSLRTVTDAIEQLAGDGRLVGVITHVPELAEQFPRIVVRKDRAGSTLEMVP